MTTEALSGPRRFRRTLIQLPNLMSAVRIPLTLLIVAGLLSDWGRAWALWFALAVGLLDLLDGIIARRLGQETRLGAVLDLCSDMFFSAAAMLLLLHLDRLPLAFVLAYLGREILAVHLRLYSAQSGVLIKSHLTGKLKEHFVLYGVWLTLVQVVYPDLPPPLGGIVAGVSAAGLWGGLLLAWLSLSIYFRQFLRGFRD